jgi:hypothetical protein
MPDEIVSTTGTTVVAASADAPVTPSYLVDGEGDFADGFRDRIDESIRSEKSLDGFTNINQVLKSYVATKKMVGADVVKIPNKNSTPAEVEQFYKSLGRPDKPEGYQLVYPKDMPVEEDANLRTTWLQAAHKLGYNQEQTAGAYEFYNNMVRQAITLNVQQEEQAKTDAETVLKTKWGDAYSGRLHSANMMVEQFTTGETKDKILAKIGNDPDVADFLANIAVNFEEHKSITGTAISTKMTPAEAESQMKVKIEERAKITDKSSEVYKRLCREISELAASSLAGQP